MRGDTVYIISGKLCQIARPSLLQKYGMCFYIVLLTDWVNNWLSITDWVNDWENYGMTDRVNKWLTEWQLLAEYAIDWVND